MVLVDFFSVSNAYPNAPSTIPTVAPYKRFCSFLPCFFSVLLLHSGHTSKQQFFHCFSIVSRMLYAIMVPHRSLNFTWHHFTLSLFFPPFPLLSHFFHCFMSKSLLFSIVFLIIFPSFPIFPIVLCHIPSFFLLFFSSFSPPLQSAQIHLGGRTRGESIPQRHPIATWYITLKKFTCGHLFYHLISSFLSLSGRSAPRPP